ncbi:hypothetical protein E2562_032898 [Oryza meyeriana var. granulata]|uniref:DUF834 domain-containing protein n=1 Tax=Oryza meyeriana var. granulata TaxID=110450 RepID=A0A6G1F0S2_9ORYZ|nr:hypothetical protein E2562_032898 [Oryza meyeriana var. granulata]
MAETKRDRRRKTGRWWTKQTPLGGGGEIGGPEAEAEDIGVSEAPGSGRGGAGGRRQSTVVPLVG